MDAQSTPVCRHQEQLLGPTSTLALQTSFTSELAVRERLRQRGEQGLSLQRGQLAPPHLLKHCLALRPGLQTDLEFSFLNEI